MESTADKVDEPFGRQPQPVTVTLIGDTADVMYWIRQLGLRAEFKGDSVIYSGSNSFTIYPRAVND
jgi:hypothetical protein